MLKRKSRSELFRAAFFAGEGGDWNILFCKPVAKRGTQYWKSRVRDDRFRGGW
jgi:hypothetical protein